MRDRCLCKNMQKVVSEFGVQVSSAFNFFWKSTTIMGA